MTDRHIVLVGMMGAGKTTVGRLVADRLARPFLDADEEIERRAGRPVADIFATDGEEAFRDLESAILAELLVDPTPSVVAAGGGAILDPTTRAQLRDAAISVWLRATPAELRARLGSGSGRPLLQSDTDVERTLDRLSRERAGLYEEVADLVVDVDGHGPTEVAEQVVAAVAEVAA